MLTLSIIRFRSGFCWMMRFVLVIPLLAVTAGRLDAANVYAFLLCDTDAEDLGDTMEADRKHVLELLRTAFDENELKIADFHGTDAETVKFTDALDGVVHRAVDGDVVFVYYTGHGGRSKRGHQQFALHHSESGVNFQVYLRRIKDLKCRSIFLYDCCCGGASPRPRAGKGNAEPTIDDEPRPAEANRKLVRELFFGGQDCVVIAATKEGQVATATGDCGGDFTASLIDAVCVSDEVADKMSEAARDADDSLWKRILNRINAVLAERSPGQMAIGHCLDEQYSWGCYVEFKNETTERVKLWYRYQLPWTAYDDPPDDFDGYPEGKEWYVVTLKSGESCQVTDEDGDPVIVDAVAYTADGLRSGRYWSRTGGSRTPVPLPDVDLPYNAGRDGEDVKTHTFKFKLRTED